MKGTARKVEPADLQLFLRIKHPHIDPAEITRELELTPEHANKAGPSVSPRGVKKLHSESYWLASLPVESIKELVARARQMTASSESISIPPNLPKIPYARLRQAAGLFEMHLIGWLKKLESHGAFIKRIVDEGGSITLVLQRADRNSPLNLGPTLRLLADLEIGIEID